MLISFMLLKKRVYSNHSISLPVDLKVNFAN